MARIVGVTLYIFCLSYVAKPLDDSAGTQRREKVA